MRTNQPTTMYVRVILCLGVCALSVAILIQRGVVAFAFGRPVSPCPFIVCGRPAMAAEFHWWMWRCEDAVVVKKVHEKFAGFDALDSKHSLAMDHSKSKRTKDGLVFYRDRASNKKAVCAVLTRVFVIASVVCGCVCVGVCGCVGVGVGVCVCGCVGVCVYIRAASSS